MTIQESAPVRSVNRISPADAVRKPLHKSTLMALLAVASLVAGYAAAVAIDRVHGQDGYFLFPEEVTAMFPPMGQPIPKEVLAAKDRANRMLDYSNTTLSLAMFGTVLTGLFGLAIGIARKQISAGILGLFTGAVLGALFGAAAGAAEVFAGHQLTAFLTEGDMFGAILRSAAAWIAISVGIGLTVGLAAGNIRHCGRLIGAAMLGGAVAAIIYAPASAILFASEKSDQFVPVGLWSRTVWMSSAGIFIALLLTWVLTDRTVTESGSLATPAKK